MKITFEARFCHFCDQPVSREAGAATQHIEFVVVKAELMPVPTTSQSSVLHQTQIISTHCTIRNVLLEDFFGSKPGFWLIIKPRQAIKGLPGRWGTPKVEHVDVHEVVEPAGAPHRVEQALLLVGDDCLPVERHRMAGPVCHGQLGELLGLQLASDHCIAGCETKRSPRSTVHQHHSRVAWVCHSCVRSLRIAG